ncbi:TlpA family protein disulfide reductase, partial [Chloroflexota bacterium]
GLVILAINIGESPSTARKFVEDNGFSFHVLMDTDGNVARDYNIRGIPATFFIDRDGIIKDRKIGTFANKAEIDWRLVNSILDGD